MLFRINDPEKSKITYQVFDDEVVVVNLRKGSYYSITKSGVDIWNLLENNVSISEIVEKLSKMCKGDQNGMEKSVSNFINELLKERLIISSDKLAAGKESDHRKLKNDSNPKKKIVDFNAPIINKYMDMEEMLMVDPVHEVEESGWPNKKKS